MDANSRTLAPEITVVIPMYNRAHLVGRAIDSALTQTHAPTEVVVVDDGSTDDSAATVIAYGDSVTYAHRENGGGAAARNTGVSLARTPWVAFLDSDDWWRTDHLEVLADAVDHTGGRAAVYFRDTELDASREHRRLWDVAGFRPAGNIELALDARDWLMMPTQPLMLQSSMVKTSDYRRIGGLDVGLQRRHDTALWFRLGLDAPMCAVDGVGVVMSSDDDGRLTAIHDGQSKVYWECTRRMYSDVLARWDPRRTAEGRELRTRLALAHRRLAWYSWSEREVRATFTELFAAGRLDPGAFVRVGVARGRRHAPGPGPSETQVAGGGFEER